MSTALVESELREIQKTYAHLMLRRCRVILRNDATADDAMQDVFVKLMRFGGEFRAAQAKLRWLYRVVDRVCFDHITRQRNRRESDDDISELPIAAPGAQIVARDAVMRFLHQLDEEERKIAVLAFVDGLNQGEIAEETGFSRQTVNKKLSVVRSRAAMFLGSTHD